MKVSHLLSQFLCVSLQASKQENSESVLFRYIKKNNKLLLILGQAFSKQTDPEVVYALQPVNSSWSLKINMNSGWYKNNGLIRICYPRGVWIWGPTEGIIYIFEGETYIDQPPSPIPGAYMCRV